MAWASATFRRNQSITPAGGIWSRAMNSWSGRCDQVQLSHQSIRSPATNKAAPKSAARQSHNSPIDWAVATCRSSSAACTNLTAIEASRDDVSDGVPRTGGAAQGPLSFRAGLFRSAAAEGGASAISRRGGPGFRDFCFVTRLQKLPVESSRSNGKRRRQGFWHGIADEECSTLSSTSHTCGIGRNPRFVSPGASR